ncbi:MAG: GNAT family N-acetyltransferase [Turicibacter sp.]
METVTECLTEAGQYTEWHPVAIYHGADIVGFAMYGSFGPNKHTWIDRILIDERYQGNGYGKMAMKQLIEVVSKEYDVNTIYLSIIESNTVAYKLYTSIGFEDMKELDPENGELMFRYVVDQNIRD